MATKRRSASTQVPASETPTAPAAGRTRSRKRAAPADGFQEKDLSGAVAASAPVTGTDVPRAPRSTRKRPAASAKSAPAAAAEFSSPDSGISERERIALLAYSMWEARGRKGGSPEDDWFRAEEEIRRHRDA